MILCTIAMLFVAIIILIKSKVISIVLKMIIGLFISLILFSVLYLVAREFAIILTLAIVIYNNRKRIALLKKYKRYFKYIALICIVTVFSNILAFLVDAVLNKPAILLMILDKLHIYDIEKIVHILVFIVTFSPCISLATFVLSMQYILNKEVKENNVSFFEVIKIMNILPIILFLLIFSFISLLHSSIDNGLTDLFSSSLDKNNIDANNFEFDNDSGISSTENYVNNTTVSNNDNVTNTSFTNNTVEHAISSNNLNNNVDFNTPEKSTSEQIYHINISKENITDKIIINNDKGIVYDMNGNEIGNIEISDNKTTTIKDNMGNVIQKNDGQFIYNNEGKATDVIDNNSVDTIINPQTKEILLNDNGTIYDGKTGEIKATIEKK